MRAATNQPGVPIFQATCGYSTARPPATSTSERNCAYSPKPDHHSPPHGVSASVPTICGTRSYGGTIGAFGILQRLERLHARRAPLNGPRA